MAGFLKPVSPTRDPAVIGDGIIPITDFTHIAPRRESRPRRHANRRTTVGIGKPHASGGDTVHIRRFNLRMTVAPKYLGTMLIGHDDDEILRCTGCHENPPELTILMVCLTLKIPKLTISVQP